MDTFSDRLIRQKAIYLAQEMGVDLGYYFRWYLRGPYCPALSTDLFSMIPEIKAGYDPSSHWNLDEVSQSRLEKLSSLIKGKAGATLAKYLELLASVQFLISRGKVENENEEQIQNTLESYGKKFSLKEIKQAKGDLREIQLL